MLVSIIVPVYKVEKYLNECVNSLVNQTYRELDIILVDDGSPDLCPKMCDDWEKKDSRVRVIHKSNGGLSDARNVGIDFAKGEYISFVDSDDFVAPTYIEKLLNVIVANPDCSISCCSCLQFENGVFKPIFNSNWIFSNIRFIESNEYAEKMLLMNSQHTAWGKIFKATILQTIRFRKGYNNEDILFALDFYPQVEREKIRCVEIPDTLYYYRIRPGSICQDKNSIFSFTEFQNKEIVFKELKDKKETIYQHYYSSYLKQLCDIMMWKLNNPNDFPCSYSYLCKKTWMYNNSYAKSILSDAEYSTFIHGKYLGPIVFLKFFLLSIYGKIRRKL